MKIPVAEWELRDLSRLLMEAVESGAAVSFLRPMAEDRAIAWWRSILKKSGHRGFCLVARTGAAIVGTVQLRPAWAPNQPHRGEVCKLLVDGRFQRQGLANRLMGALEREAWTDGFRLLTLDARQGGSADRLYDRLGWTRVGSIPRYALDPDGGLHDAVFFYKELSESRAEE